MFPTELYINTVLNKKGLSRYIHYPYDEKKKIYDLLNTHIYELRRISYKKRIYGTSRQRKLELVESIYEYNRNLEMGISPRLVRRRRNTTPPKPKIIREPVDISKMFPDGKIMLNFFN